MWSLLAAGTAVFFALNGAWSTRIARRIGALPGAWTLFLFALPFVGSVLAFRGVPEVDPGFWPAWGLNLLINLAAWYLLFSALRTGDLGITYPLLALTPLFVVPVEWVLLGDAPARIGLLGIALVVLGVYLLNIRTIRSGLFAPLAALAGDPSARKALAVALLWSVGGVLDRVSVLASSPAFYAFMLSAGLAAGFFPLVLIARRSGSEPAGIERPKSSEGSSLQSELAAAGRGALVLHGFLIAAMLTLQMEALTLQLASYVLSIKRMGAVLAVVIGYVAFREQGLGARLLGTLVAIGGAAILVVLG
jgi:drug/metabolite transporter (DMT)-like permease